MGTVILLTGQPGSGKTTIAKALQEELGDAIVIDGDALRRYFPTGYSIPDRMLNVRRAHKIAAMIAEQNITVIVSLIQPFEYQRNEMKQEHDAIEVYLHTREIRGREDYFCENYQPPERDFLDLDTGKLTLEECVNRIVSVVVS